MKGTMLVDTVVAKQRQQLNQNSQLVRTNQSSSRSNVDGDLEY